MGGRENKEGEEKKSENRRGTIRYWERGQTGGKERKKRREREKVEGWIDMVNARHMHVWKYHSESH
jgi:hypothetical protein